MSYNIRYTDKWTGKQKVHKYEGSRAGAEAWAKSLSNDNRGCRAEATHIENGPFDYLGKEIHILTVGND